MDLKEQAVLGDDALATHWYYRAKAAAVRRLLRGARPAALLDVGAGSGFFARTLLEEPSIRSGVCVDPGYREERDELVGGKPLRFRRTVDQAGADLVLLMDVLEHVDDDLALLGDYVAKSPRGARFVITVPAFQMLWSGHDAFLEHRRRYTLRGLEKLARAAGLGVERGCYFYGLLFPLAAASRLLGNVAGRNEPRSQMRRSCGMVNSALAWTCLAELPLLRANRLAGLTAMALATKA